MTSPAALVVRAALRVAAAGFAAVCWAAAVHAQPHRPESAAERHEREAAAHGRGAGLGALGDTAFATGDLEARLWYFGYRPSAVVLRRVGGAWRVLRVEATGATLAPDRQSLRWQYATAPRPAPDTAVEARWARLEAAGLDTLADDAGRVPPDLEVIDGESYVVEVRRGPRYRIAAFPYASVNAPPGAPARRVRDLFLIAWDPFTRRRPRASQPPDGSLEPTNARPAPTARAAPAPSVRGPTLALGREHPSSSCSQECALRAR